MKRTAVHFDDEIFLQGDVYHYRGTPMGLKRRVERSLGLRLGATQREVLKKKKEILDSLERAGEVGGRFAAVALRYKDDRKAEFEAGHLAPRTYRETLEIMDGHFIPYFGRYDFIDIDQAKFIEYCIFKRRQGYNLVNHRKVMNHFLKWGLHNKYHKYLMVLEIPKQAYKARRKREVLNESEIKSLLTACKENTLLYVAMYLFMGMRNMEICKLRWDEVDLKTKAIFINPQSNRRRKSRAIPINKYVYEILKARPKTSDWVFPSRVSKGKYPHLDPSRGFRDGWERALELAGIEKHITPHDLRATFETFMHTNREFTDTQREKMVGARIDVQKDHYVKMQVEQIRGLEEAVQVEGVDQIFEEKSKLSGGKLGGKKIKKGAVSGTSS